MINSRWSRLGPILIIWLGAGLYGLIAAGSILLHPAVAKQVDQQTALGAGLLLEFALLSAAGAGCWFLFVQAALLRRFCLYCSITHGLAIAVAALGHATYELNTARMLPFAAGAVATLIVLQVLWKHRTWAMIPAAPNEAPSTSITATIEGTSVDTDEKKAKSETFILPSEELSHSSVDPSEPPSEPRVIARASAPSSSAAVATPPRQITLAGGALKISINDWLLSGPVDAPTVIALLHDPTCKTCRQTHRVAIEAVQKAEGQLAFLCIPVPQDRACNPSAGAKQEKKPNETCQITKLTLTLHRFAPDACHAFEQWFLDFPDNMLPPFEAALRKAQQLAPEVMAKYWPPLPAVESRLRAALTIFQAARATQVPTLVFPKTAVVGLVPTADKLLEIVDREFGVRPIQANTALRDMSFQ